MTVVKFQASNETVVINSGSSAPRSVREETFLANPNLAKIGYSSIGTPGFLHGIWTAYKRFGSGRIAWQDLLLPTIHLLERGRYSNRSDISLDINYLVDLLAAQRSGLMRLEQIGDPDFAVSDPVKESLAERRNNSINDSEEEAEDVGGVDINGLLWKLNHEDTVGSHINVIDNGHMAVSLSSTINEKFGSVRRFEKGGFIWNNAMSGFTIHDKEDSEDMHENSVEGRKRSRTSMAPLMLFNQEGQLIGSYGITGSLNSILGMSQVLLHRILFDMRLLSEMRTSMSLDPLLLIDSVVHVLERSSNGTLKAVCDFRDDSDQCARGF
ncbi:unnamed protein product [Strongylus vulgaris]|uniref:Gamma-glutamyltranspeptidase n=1 Tax=Strongylus vulgaris TaxID=40348 RepID=A0A3P7JMN4_STRVU|nr:unnamed protein product [Strongylus vulgaris]